MSPINYKLYPPNWKELRRQVLERAKNRCECEGECGLHKTIGRCVELNGEKAKYAKGKIVLTIAHLDHDENNHDIRLDRLKALCQRCHLRMDLQQHITNRKKNLEKKRGQMRLFE